MTWVLYDGDCGVCRAFVRFWEPTLAKHGFKIAPLQAPWVAERFRLPKQELLRDIRMIAADGRFFAGADVYLQAAKRIWWAWPFYALFSLPGLNQFLHFGYRRFADNRGRITTACKLS